MAGSGGVGRFGEDGRPGYRRVGDDLHAAGAEGGDFLRCEGTRLAAVVLPAVLEPDLQGGLEFRYSRVFEA